MSGFQGPIAFGMASCSTLALTVEADGGTPSVYDFTADDIDGVPRRHYVELQQVPHRQGRNDPGPVRQQGRTCRQGNDSRDRTSARQVR